jgi:hypothetical protein
LQPLGDQVDHLIAILGTRGSALHELDELAPDVPVRDHHRAVDRANDLRSRLLHDSNDALDEGRDIVTDVRGNRPRRHRPHPGRGFAGLRPLGL